ncbi:hypothetical protein D9M68_875300 [compost metagenome]
MQDRHQLAIAKQGRPQQIADPQQLATEPLDGDFLVTQDFVHQQGEALTAHLEQQQGQLARRALQTAQAEHIAQGPDRQHLCVEYQRGAILQVLHGTGRQSQAALHRQRRHGESALGIAHYHRTEGGQA